LDATIANAYGRISHSIYFLRAGTLVSLPALLTGPMIFLVLLAGKVASKILGLYPFISFFRTNHNERWFYTLLMSTGLTFGTISALFGLSHSLITQEQYSFLVAAVIASAVVPTVIAGKAFLPTHLLETKSTSQKAHVEPTLSEEG
jgi:Kef-type K+ transport system membrane component KefB